MKSRCVGAVRRFESRPDFHGTGNQRGLTITIRAGKYSEAAELKSAIGQKKNRPKRGRSKCVMRILFFEYAAFALIPKH